ncbi:hypothetical protein HOB06_00365 [archaeon]|nr:hypothetical protein [archaeon]
MVSSELLKEFGFEEETAEVIKDQFEKTGFPLSKKRYRMVYEVPDLGLEGPYFWVVDEFRKKYYTKVLKIEDSFSASENSAFFGVTQQRLGAQQDKISQFLATVGKMVKELFQMVRELRIIDERLAYYDGSYKEIKKPLGIRHTRDEITLKGIFVDLVQGGGKSPSSVFGMASQLEFVALPDLFFDAPPFKTREEMEIYVDGLTDFNQAVLRVLKRHLNHFTEWKKRTLKEHKDRRRFQLRYLGQHYDIIQMYMTWIKPYLKNVQRLNLKGAHQDSADLVSAFEGSMTDVEIIGHKEGVDHCVMVTFQYRTKPHLKFVQEGYQRGPVHVGKMDMQIRIYDWDKETIQKYRKMKEKENLYLLGDVSQSVLDSMQALGGELEKYYNESKGKFKQLDASKVEEEAWEEIKREKKNRPLIYKLFGDFLPEPKSKKKIEDGPAKLGNGDKLSRAAAWGVYRFFKKSHRLVTW